MMGPPKNNEKGVHGRKRLRNTAIDYDLSANKQGTSIAENLPDIFPVLYNTAIYEQHMQ